MSKTRHLTNQDVPMPAEYEEMMRHYLPDVPKALIVDAWKHNATPTEVQRHLDRIAASRITGEPTAPRRPMSDEEIFDTAAALGLPYEVMPETYCYEVGLPIGSRAYGDVTREQLLAFARAVMARCGITGEPTA